VAFEVSVSKMEVCDKINRKWNQRGAGGKQEERQEEKTEAMKNDWFCFNNVFLMRFTNRAVT